MNMPRIGYLSNSEHHFLDRLDRLMALARESLETKRKVLENFTDRNLYPYTKYYLRGVKERFGEYWKNHFSTIGLVGMNEACLNLFGRSIGTREGQEFAKRVLDFMRDRLVEFQNETGNNYNLESTPAEGTSYRLAQMDRKKYPDILVAASEQDGAEKGEPFYTNSTQLPVNYTDDLFEALDLQDEIQTKYTGGTVFHIFAGERIEDPDIIKKLIQRICSQYHIPYLTFTPTFSVCPSHGYLRGEQAACPECQEPCEIYSRVVGYLRPVKQWNKGKQQEFSLRREYAV
jgi:ribonucleoside-triphosphate reductase